MPPVGRDWTAEQMDAVTEYLRNLAGARGGGAGGG